MYHHSIALALAEARIADLQNAAAHNESTASPRRRRAVALGRAAIAALGQPARSPSPRTTPPPWRRRRPMRSTAITSRPPRVSRSRSPTRSAGRAAPAQEPGCSNQSPARQPPPRPAWPPAGRAPFDVDARGPEQRLARSLSDDAGVAAATEQAPAADEQQARRSRPLLLAGCGHLRSNRARARSGRGPGVRPRAICAASLLHPWTSSREVLNCWHPRQSGSGAATWKAAAPPAAMEFHALSACPARRASWPSRSAPETMCSRPGYHVGRADAPSPWNHDGLGRILIGGTSRRPARPPSRRCRRLALSQEPPAQ